MKMDEKKWKRHGKDVSKVARSKDESATKTCREKVATTMASWQRVKSVAEKRQKNWELKHMSKALILRSGC